MNKLLINTERVHPLVLLSSGVVNVISESLETLPLVVESAFNQIQLLAELSRAELVCSHVSIYALQF